MVSWSATQTANLLFASCDELLDIAKIKGVISCEWYVRRTATAWKISAVDFETLDTEEKRKWIGDYDMKLRNVALRYGVEASDKKKEILIFLIMNSMDGKDIEEYTQLRKKQHGVLERFSHLDKLNDHQIGVLKDTVKGDDAILSTVPTGRWNAAQHCVWLSDVDMLDFVLGVNAEASLSYISKDGRSVESIIENMISGTTKQAMQGVVQKHKSKKRRGGPQEEEPDAKRAAA